MIRVMIVDDSPLVRKIAGDIIASDPEMEVVATAANAEFALNKLQRGAPDVITMDIEMPGLGGLEAIRRIMGRRPTPIIVLSSHAQRGADLTLQALEAGAIDFVLKPSASLSGGINAVAEELLEKVRSAAGSTMARSAIVPQAEAPSEVPEEPRAAEAEEKSFTSVSRSGRFELVAIGTSTGGPIALKTVLSGLPANFPIPVVVVQHMPPVFTKAFADRLNAICAIEVKEAEDGDEMLAGRVLIAPGDFHMRVARSNRVVKLDKRDQVSGHRPSVDVLMHSVAWECGARAVGVIMTGMGKDGAAGISELHRKGGVIIAQDKESSVIFGMNREVIFNGDADMVLPVDRIAGSLMRIVNGDIAAHHRRIGEKIRK